MDQEKRGEGSNPSPSAIVAFLRGVNNVGSRRVTMAALKAAFEAMGFADVRTVLASGNVVFRSSRKVPHLVKTIERGLEKALGFPVPVAVRTAGELRAMIASDPFQGVNADARDAFYVTFLPDGPPRPLRLQPVEPGERFRIVRAGPREIFSVVLLSQGGQTPDLMRYLDRALGRAGTTRNWRTVLKLLGPPEPERNPKRRDHGRGR